VHKTPIIIALSLIFILLDLYSYYFLKRYLDRFSVRIRKVILSIFWVLVVFTVAGIFMMSLGNPTLLKVPGQQFILVVIFANYFGKLMALLFLIPDEIIRGFKWIKYKLSKDPSTKLKGKLIPRSEFLSKAALITAALPAVSMGFGIISGAHDYRIRHKIIRFPHLPSGFDGFRIAQLSDIHSGSFFNRNAVKGGVDLLLQEKPDAIFFTGDLVNYETKEINQYFDIFNKVRAPYGVFSTLGNHDYGDYRSWPTVQAKRKNLEDMLEAHKVLGWDLLMNENRLLGKDGESLAIIGIENWGTGRFPKYGKMDEACKGTDSSPVKLLLSHDPSHWDAEVRPSYQDIDLMFAGHTHGFQFGVEIGNFKWSPSQYVYKQWADLYEAEHQKLYVNRGYGFIGFPGRIGIAPEITIFELKKA
jgi:uncharacterized protein